MKKNTKLALGVIGVAAVGYYLYKKMKTSTTTLNYSGEVGDRVGSDGLWSKVVKATKPYLPQVYHPENATSKIKAKAFASDAYVTKGELYNNNMRYGMTGQQTFFTNESEKVNY